MEYQSKKKYQVFKICFSEDVVVAEDLVAEEPAEIDGEIDSESDENPSSSSEEGTYSMFSIKRTVLYGNTGCGVFKRGIQN
mgnify:CR=1 FL=1